jgi:hypothetical protein
VTNERNSMGKHCESTRREATLTLPDVVAGSDALFLSFTLWHSVLEIDVRSRYGHILVIAYGFVTGPGTPPVYALD